MTGAEKVRAALYARLRERLGELTVLLAAGAPDCIVSGALRQLGQLAPMLDPEGWASQRAAAHAAEARRIAGVCMIPACDSDVTVGERLCAEHAAGMDIEFRAAVEDAHEPDKDDVS